MKAYGVFFEVNNHGIYTRLTNVFEYSFKKNMPGIDLEIIKLPNPVIGGKKFQHQIIKQRVWTEIALSQKEDYIILDTDMLIIGNLTEAFEYDFDIAYTYREKERKPLNGGMIWGRPNKRSEKFWLDWLKLCEESYYDKQLWSNLNVECKGFAQTALWHIIQNSPDCSFKKLSCQEWNACDEEWDYIDAGTKAYHIKGRMRKSLFRDLGIANELVYKTWKEYEREYNSSC